MMLGSVKLFSEFVTSDLQYTWDDSEMSLDLQYRFAQHDKPLRVFIAIAENTADIRTALRTDFQVDPNAGADQRAETAKVASAWTAVKQLYEKETELHAEQDHGAAKEPTT